MPNYFRKAPATSPVAAPVTNTMAPMTGKPGFIDRMRLRMRDNGAKYTVQSAAIDAAEREALALVKTTAEMQGQQVRAEMGRQNALVLSAIGLELVRNASAGYQAMGSARFAGTVTNLDARTEMLKEIERLISEGAATKEDAEALFSTAADIHAETEALQDEVFETTRAMVKRAFEAATATSTVINSKS